MYEDSWYSFVPDVTNQQPKKPSSQGPGHRRKESLLQQPGGTSQVEVPVAEPLGNVYEEIENTNTPPEPAIVRRAASYSDFYRVARAQTSKEESQRRKKAARKERQWEALMLPDKAAVSKGMYEKRYELDTALDRQLLDTSQEDYTIYRDQLTLTERHLDGLIEDANTTLKLLTTLSDSFESVESQTSSFRSKCEDLLNEQRRLEKLASDVGSDLGYYAYLDTVSRRLNAPGASRLVDSADFGDMIDNIEACIVFLEEHESYRDRDTYLARYNSLLTKALHLLDHGFTSRMEKTMADIGQQVAASQSKSTQHALAYGRFEEKMLDTYELLPNVQKVARNAYDQYGRLLKSPRDISVYKTTSLNIFKTYLTIRGQYLKPMTGKSFFGESTKEKDNPSEGAEARNIIKISFERLYDEDCLFSKVFGVDPAWSNSPDSVFQELRDVYTGLLHPGQKGLLGISILIGLDEKDGLEKTCNVVGWLASEYLISDPDEEETAFFRKCREYAAHLLVDDLWPAVDSMFEARVDESITKGAMQDSELTIGPVEGGVASSNAHPLVKKAVSLLVQFDQAMPKERSSKNSPVVFKIVRETIQVLQKAEARIKSIKSSTDPDLFMVKNLLIIKNELVSLEIGDIRGQASSSMQHFGQIWDTLSPTNWISFVGSIVGGSIWSRGKPAITAKTLTVEDMNEQLDELLRQSIYAFTKRWGTLMNDSKARKAGVKPIAKIEAELEKMLLTAFSNQPEVIAKLKEAIDQNAQALNDADNGKQGVKHY